MKPLQRSPSRRASPPPPPRLSHRSPGFSRRGRSPERRRRGEPQARGGGSGGRMSPPRSRERREFRQSPRSQTADLPVIRSRSPIRESSQPPDFPVFRRSRSPVRDSKRRSFSPKRKTPSKRERRDAERERPPRPMVRKRTRSKSPSVSSAAPVREGAPRIGSYVSPSEGTSQGRNYQSGDAYPPEETGLGAERAGRSMSSLGDRFQGAGRGSYDDDHGGCNVFRGPDGTGYDLNEIKKITVDIRRNLPVSKTRVERTIIPEDVVLRRSDGTPFDLNKLKTITVKVPVNKSQSVEQSLINPEDIVLVRRPGEGSHPIFAREEIIHANERSRHEREPSPYERRSVPSDEHHRVVAIPSHTQTSGGSRFESPPRYGPSHSSPYFDRGDRDHSGPSREYVRSRSYERSHGPSASFDPRDKNREDRFERRDDLRHDLEMRRRDESRYSGHGDGVRYDKGREYRESDRHEDREPGRHHPMDRHEGGERERERRPMIQSSPPGDRRRGFSHMGDPERKSRDGRMPPGSHGAGSRRNDVPERFHQDGEFGRSERFAKPWNMNPEYVPKGRAYFEHDNREEMRMPNRGRGSMGPRHMRGRGMMRGRPFRGTGGLGPTRGFMISRGRRGGYSPRGFYNVY